MAKVGAGILTGVLAGVTLGVFLSTSKSLSQPGVSTTHTIYMSAIEIKGSSSTDKLAPPPVNPATLSRGYGFKAPGEADKHDPKKWEVSSYLFVPGYITVHQGDTVNLIIFVVNHDLHEVGLTDPDGREVIAKAGWNRGQEYKMSFVAEKPGSYHLVCATHAPTMKAIFLVLPR